MADKTWKRREREVMARYGTTRKPVSGRQRDKDGDDGEHPRLHIQQKHRQSHAILKTYHAAAVVARKNGKIPLVTLTERGVRGHFVLCHVDDIKLIAQEVDKKEAD